jgi:hypothetical protein
MQSSTLLVNSDDGQKQAASLLESHFGMESQVLMHVGTTPGQGAGTIDESGVAGVVLETKLGVTLAEDEGQNVDDVV